MIVMPANNTKAFELNREYPGRVGMMFSPRSWQNPKDLIHAYDNGRYTCWSRGAEWDECHFNALLEKGSPSWVAVPDVVADAVATFEEWQTWAPRLEKTFALALVVQDGMTVDSVRRYTDPDVIFVGGTTDWKRNTLFSWCRNFPRVHVGRVNYEKWLWHADRCGAESCDGTGWFRGDQRQLAGMIRYLETTEAGRDLAQMELEYSGGKRFDTPSDEMYRHMGLTRPPE